jgi:hypothetical protein
MVAIASTLVAMVIKAATTAPVTTKITMVGLSVAVLGTRIRPGKTTAPISEAVTETGDIIRIALS